MPWLAWSGITVLTVLEHCNPVVWSVHKIVERSKRSTACAADLQLRLLLLLLPPPSLLPTVDAPLQYAKGT